MESVQSVGEFLADAYVLQNDRLGRVRKALEANVTADNMQQLAKVAQDFVYLTEKNQFLKLQALHTVLYDLYRTEAANLPPIAKRQAYKQQLTMFVTHVHDCVHKALRRISKGEQEGNIKAEILRLDGSNFLLQRFLPLASSNNLWSGQNDFDKTLLEFLQEQSENLEYFLPEARTLLENLETSLTYFASEDKDNGINRFFRLLHTFKGSSYMVMLTEVGDVAHLLEDALSLVREGNMPSEQIVSTLRLGLHSLNDIVQFLSGKGESATEHLGKLLVSLRPLLKHKPNSQDLLRKLDLLMHIPEADLHTEPVSNVAQNVQPQRDLETKVSTQQNSESISSIRVNVDNLDVLATLSSELILSRRQQKQQQRLLIQMDKDLKKMQDYVKKLYEVRKHDSYKKLYQQMHKTRHHQHKLLQELREDSDYVTDLSYRLREQVSQTRMVPMSQLFLHLRRLVEQLAAEHDAQAPQQRKNYRLETLGETITMDGGVLEALIAPMRHIINNAVIHGIEPLHERAANGKLPEGSVRLEATRYENHIRLDVSDDGRGLDFNEIQAKALERGLKTVEQIATMTEQETFELILLPGFSTVQRVGKHAGRGVGLDVVNSYVNKLKGRITINSQYGKGTRISLEIPASIASNEVLSIQIGNQEFSLPSERVVNLRRIPKGLRRSNEAMEEIQLENQTVTYYDLKKLLGISGSPAQKESDTLPVVMMQDGNDMVLLGVENFGKLEPAILYPMPPLLQKIKHLNGMSLLRDGRVLPLLNGEGMQELYDVRKQPKQLTKVLSTSTFSPNLTQKAARLSDVREHILIAEDSKTVRELMAQWLRREGFRVTAMPDGQQALDYLLKNPVDMLLTDLEMPHMDGYELMEAVADQLGSSRRMPIIVISSRIKTEHQNLAMDLGADAYFAKPVKSKKLLEKISVLLSESNR